MTHRPLFALALAVALTSSALGALPSGRRLSKMRAVGDSAPTPIDLSKYAGQTVMVVAVRWATPFLSFLLENDWVGASCGVAVGRPQPTAHAPCARGKINVMCALQGLGGAGGGVRGLVA